MPLYEYECRQCGVRTEALQRVSDPPLTTCGECGGELKKLLSPPAFQFKGSGWYVTDYARAKPAASGDGAGAAKGAEAGDGAAKPAAGKSDAPAAKPAGDGGKAASSGE